jgi:hypothetical protein
LTIDKGKILKTIGWSAIGVGLYLVTLGTTYESESIFRSSRPDDGIIDADFTIIEE